jgi:hypothetical protein
VKRFDEWWRVKEGNLSDGLGNGLPNWDMSLGRGGIVDWWGRRVSRRFLRGGFYNEWDVKYDRSLCRRKGILCVSYVR